MEQFIEPKVSIITVVYNAATTIERTIESVLSQSYKNREYIIIDGGSTDGTLDVIDKYRDKLAYFVSEPDNGIYDAMNKGIKKATGDIIGLLNADDWYEIGALACVAAEFKRTGASIIAGGTLYVDQHGNKSLRKQNSFSELWKHLPSNHQATFISKAAYDTFGLYDTQYKIAADHELLLRMYHGGVSFSIVDTVFVNYSITGCSAVFAVRSAEEKSNICKKYLNKYPGKKDEIDCYCKRMILYAKAKHVLEQSPSSVVSIVDSLCLDEKSNLVIWGTGIWGRRINEFFFQIGKKVSFFVDSNSNKWETKLENIFVKSPDFLQTFSGVVFIAVKDYENEIVKQIVNLENPNIRFILLSKFLEQVAKLYENVPS